MDQRNSRTAQKSNSKRKVAEGKENAVPTNKKELAFADGRSRRLKRCLSLGSTDGNQDSKPGVGVCAKKTPFRVHCEDKDARIGGTESTSRRNEERSNLSSLRTEAFVYKDAFKTSKSNASRSDRLVEKENARAARSSKPTRSTSMLTVSSGRTANSSSKIPILSSDRSALNPATKETKSRIGDKREKSERSKQKELSQEDGKTSAKSMSKGSWKPIRFKETKSSANESSRKSTKDSLAKPVEPNLPSASKRSALAIKSASTKAAKGLESEARGSADQSGSVKKSVELKMKLRAAGTARGRLGSIAVRSIERKVGLRKSLLKKSAARSETVDFVSTQTPYLEVPGFTDFKRRRYERRTDAVSNSGSRTNGSDTLILTGRRVLASSSRQNTASKALDEISTIPFVPTQARTEIAKGSNYRDKALKRENVDRFPAELAYHLEYLDDVPLVECEKEERAYRLSRNFLSENFNVEQRKIIVVFLIRLGTHCRYPSFVIYQSVKLFDVVMDRAPVQTIYMQLVALATLWITLKREGNVLKLPSASSMISHARELYENREDLLIQCEREILIAVDFNVTFPDPFSLFAYYMINCKRHVDIPEGAITYAYYCGGYLIDLTLMDEKLCCTSSSLVASTAAELVLCVTIDRTLSPVRCQLWRNTITSNSTSSKRFQDMEIVQLRETMVKYVLISAQKHSRFEVVYKKYKCSRYGRISELFVEAIRKTCERADTHSRINDGF
ncbi:hypothetical protein KM043_003172 [Ampulex compressa]|nr:hypothetical protein KM043_003172 [Ampulex compressa]